MIFSYSAFGYTGHVVKVEVDISRGIPSIDIIGLASSEIREAKDRVRVALKNSGYNFPNGRILINLSPAGIKKAGVAFDLALAVAILIQSKQIELPPGCADLLVLGELELSGKINAVSGVIAAVDEGKAQKIGNVLLSPNNEEEAGLIHGVRIACIEHLSQLLEFAEKFVEKEASLHRVSGNIPPYKPDFSDYKGNPRLIRSTMIAAVGRHNVFYYGPPGYGKTMAATRIPSLFPPLSYEESVSVTRIYSLSENTANRTRMLAQAPFRSPHHSSTLEGVVGGGKNLSPGEISLAHCGILFLDEVLEFRFRLLQALREPIEQHEVYLSRAGKSYWFPADFQLVLCSNLCPCGNFGHSNKECLCSRTEIFHYWRKFGAALLDRVEIRIFTNEEIGDEDHYCDFDDIKQKCHEAIEIQRKRCANAPYIWNSRLQQEELRQYCKMDAETELYFGAIMKEQNVSRRGQFSILRIARSIADLEHEERILSAHIKEAAANRSTAILTTILGI